MHMYNHVLQGDIIITIIFSTYYTKKKYTEAKIFSP